MIELILVRHGETDSNRKGTYLGWTDVELNGQGLIQAGEVAKRLQGCHVDRIFASPLKRTLRTAQIINEEFRLPIEEVEALKERNFGIWDNLTHREITGKYPAEYEAWTKDWVNYCVSEGESSIQAYKRITGFIEGLVAANSSGVFLIVTHLGCIRKIIAYLLGMTIEDTWRFRVDNCGITRLEINEEKYAYLTLLNG